MKAAFFHDHIFLKYKGLYYSKGKLTYRQLSYYLEYCQELIVVSRYQEVYEAPPPEFLSLGKNVSIKGYPGVLTRNFMVNRKNYLNEIANTLLDVDVVFSRMPSEFGILATNMAKKLNINCIVEMVASPFDCLWYRGDIFAKLYAPFLHYRVKKALKNAESVIYVTNSYLQQAYPTRGRCIAVSDARVCIQSEGKELDKNKLMRIGIIANPSLKLKGVESLYHAMSLLPKNKYVLSIVGGTNVSEIELIMSKDDNVELKGIIADKEELNKWLSTIDLYIQPSFTEGLPRSIVEAMSFSIPVLGSKVGGIPELVHSNYLFKAGNSKDIASKILSVSEDKIEYLKLSEHSKKMAERFNSNLDDRKREFIINAISAHS